MHSAHHNRQTLSAGSEPDLATARCVWWASLPSAHPTGVPMRKCVTRELQVISDFYDLMHEASKRVEKFPRAHRFTPPSRPEGRDASVGG